MLFRSNDALSLLQRWGDLKYNSTYNRYYFENVLTTKRKISIPKLILPREFEQFINTHLQLQMDQVSPFIEAILSRLNPRNMIDKFNRELREMYQKFAKNYYRITSYAFRKYFTTRIYRSKIDEEIRNLLIGHSTPYSRKVYDEDIKNPDYLIEKYVHLIEPCLEQED